MADNAGGRWISKTVYPTGQYVRYCYDGDQVIAEYDGAGTLLRKFVYAPGVDEPICMIAVDDQTETRYYYHYDGLGSVVALSNNSGTIVERYQYSVFGETQILSADYTPRTASLYGNSYLFTGREYEASIGLYYYRARFYNPELGRFLQTDPIGYADGLNWYAYCGNNPINFVDPIGLCRRQNYRGNFFIDFGVALWKEKSNIGQALNDGIAIYCGNATFGLWDNYLESLGYETSEAAIRRQGGAGQFAKYASNVSGGALAAAIALEALGVDIVLWGTGAAASNSNSTQNMVSAANPLSNIVKTFEEISVRPTAGADGGTSMIVKTVNAETGETLKVIHQVVDITGKVIHEDIKFVK